MVQKTAEVFDIGRENHVSALPVVSSAVKGLGLWILFQKALYPVFSEGTVVFSGPKQALRARTDP